MSNGTAGTAYGYYPHSSERGGDIIFGGTGDNPDLGDFDWATVGHEIGHALGLAHGHESSGNSTTLDANFNSLEYSIMTYFSYVNHDRVNYAYNTVEPWGNPQTLMIYDIAAIQHLYGANFAFNADDNTYTFSTTTGEMFIDGVGQGAPGGNRIFRTIWDGNGTDTYDFSNYTTDLNIDLTPGGYSDLDVGGNAQRSDLGYFGPGAGVEMARGHIFNALQYQGDARSLIENANGGSGNDTITGNTAENSLRGLGGDDILNGGDGNDYLMGGDGADTLNGGDGLDYAFYTDSTSAVNVNLGGTVTGGTATGDTLISIENVAGSDFGDKLYGTNGDNVFVGYGGRDIIYGYGGNDTIVGGDEVGAGDFIVAGDGNDLVAGEGGDDTIYGGTGNDQIVGGTGRDIIYGEVGDDIIVGGDEVGAGDLIVGGAGQDQVAGGDGNDTIYGGDDMDILLGEGGRDIIFGEAGNDSISGGDETGSGDLLLGGAGNDIILGNGGNDQIYGGTGADEISGGDGTDILYVDSADTVVSGGAGSDYLVVYNDTGGSYVASDIENWYGTSGAETFDGSGNADTQIMQGYAGADIITGGNGNDYLLGGNDNDTLTGGSGNDQLYGDAGADQLTGGAGSDILFFDGDDTLVSGGDGYDYALAQSGSGSVTLNMNSGQIEYAVGSENGDILSADGYNAHVSIVGGGGNDSIYAGIAGSYLNGGAGNDNIVMGTVAATDGMIGGAGADTFWMRDNGGTDYIYDFEDGTDLINATLLTSDTSQGVGNFTINTSNAASGWYGVGYEGGNVLWIQAGQGATIDNDDFIFAASSDEPAPESVDVMSANAFDDYYDNTADVDALVAEYDQASQYDVPYDFDADMYGIDAGNAEFIV